MSEQEDIVPTRSRRWFPTEYIVLALILIAGAALRLLYLREIIHEPDFRFPYLDPQFHDYWARGLVTRDWTPPAPFPDPQIRTTAFGRPPGYPYFLAAIYLATHGSYLAARIVQMAVGLLNCVLLFFLGKKVFNRTTGLIAAAGMSLYWAFIFFEGELESPVLEIFCALLVMHALRLWLTRSSVPRALMAGLWLGVFVLFRTNVLLCAPVILLWMVWILRRRGGKLRETLVAAAVFVTGIVVAIAPVTIRNYRASGEFFLVTYNSGVNLYIGNNELTDCVMPIIPEMRALTGGLTWTCFEYPAMVRGIAAQQGKQSITFSEANDFFKRKAWDFIKKDPCLAIKRAIKRAFLFWGPAEITSNKVAYYAKLNSRILRFLPGFTVVLGLLGLGLTALAIDIRKKAAALEMPVLIIGFILSYFATFLPFLVSGRFRVPLIPFLLLFGAYGLYRLGQFIRNREHRLAGITAAGGVAFFVLASIPFVPYKPEEDLWHYHRGMAFRDAGNTDAAIAELNAAIQAGGESTGPLVYSNLADIFAKQGKSQEAIACYQQGIKLAPDDPNLNNNLALLLVDQKKYDEAVPHYLAALRTVPRDARVLSNLGFALFMQGKSAEAIARINEALALTPDLAPAQANLAMALAAAGRFQEAVREYGRISLEMRQKMAAPMGPTLGALLEKNGKKDAAMQLYEAILARNPSDAQTYVDLGNLLVEAGKINDAMIRYDQALEADPKNRDAHFNIAAVNAAQGHYEDALYHFAACLELNPRDNGARLQAGAILIKMKKIDAAMEMFNDVLQLDPKNVMAHNNLGNAFAAQGKFDEAIQQYQSALEIDPKDKSAYYNMARVLEGQGKAPEAVDAFKSAIRNYPENGRIHAALAQLYAREKRLDDAASECREALRLQPNDKAARELLGRLGGK